ncbi:hypothetical protein ACMA5I_06625 [Paracoccaceae bacterium GXU_MW_L88]
MTPRHVSPEDIAEVAGLTLPYVRRVVSEFKSRSRTAWHGAKLHIEGEPGAYRIAFRDLPEHVREAFTLLDQQNLPFTPPLEHNNLD